MNCKVKEYLVCEVAHSYGVSLKHARRFTEEEKKEYVEAFRERGFVGISSYPTTDLKEINWKDVHDILNGREADGEFCGCSNSAYIISEEEMEKLVALNEQKRKEKIAKEKAEDVKFYQKVIQCCEKQERLYTREEAAAKKKEWNDIHDEGGEGYIPHFYTIEEYEQAKKRLEEAMEFLSR